MRSSALLPDDILGSEQKRIEQSTAAVTNSPVQAAGSCVKASRHVSMSSGLNAASAAAVDGSCTDSAATDAVVPGAQTGAEVITL